MGNRSSSVDLPFDSKRVEKVWTEYLSCDDKYFHRVYETAFNEDKDLARLFIPDEQHLDSADEVGFVINSLADNMSDFLGNLVKINDYDTFFNECFACGQRHAGYTENGFDEKYWPVMREAFTTGISDSQRASLAPKDITAWQNFMSKIIEYLQEGYAAARTTQRKYRLEDD